MVFGKIRKGKKKFGEFQQRRRVTGLRKLQEKGRKLEIKASFEASKASARQRVKQAKLSISKSKGAGRNGNGVRRTGRKFAKAAMIAGDFSEGLARGTGQIASGSKVFRAKKAKRRSSREINPFGF